MPCKSFIFNVSKFKRIFTAFRIRMKLEEKVMSGGCSGTAYPVYEHGGRKWVLMSVPSKHYGATGLSTNEPDV